ncbi:MAG: phospho-N-acetylmuramoyl-pentapeptide-transferase [Bacteroidia bacterium]
MLYYIFDWLNDVYQIPGFGVFQYISFRGVMAMVFSLIISLLIGKRIINLLEKKQIGEVVRDSAVGPDHAHKKGTPTMGGLIILAAIVFPVLLWGDLKNGYVWLILIGTVWMGAIGFVDDYIKVFKKDKKGLKGKFKLAGQIALGLVVGLVMLFHPDFMGSRAHITQLNVVRQSNMLFQQGFKTHDELIAINGESFTDFPAGDKYGAVTSYTLLRNNQPTNEIDYNEALDTVLLSIPSAMRTSVARELFGPRDRSFVYNTDFPFFKSLTFDYSKVIGLEHFIAPDLLGRGVYLLVVIFMITAVSNAVNLTDGIDGLAAGTTAIAGATFGVLAYLAGNAQFASYLNITYIPLSAELFVFSTALVGACIGFLWYNSYPAQVFMGDTGSLALGGVLGILALMVKKELLIPIICGVFFAETLSVIIQVSYFKYTKRKYGEGRRIFKMSPLHHHYEKAGIHESKIVTRFWIVAALLAALAFATLKLR